MPQSRCGPTVCVPSLTVKMALSGLCAAGSGSRNHRKKSSVQDASSEKQCLVRTPMRRSSANG
jgi:hypothetical protein